MTDYNDGNWHGWNGGECPVHPKSILDLLDESQGKVFGIPAECVHWTFKGALRVTEEHKEPREFWLLGIGDGTTIALESDVGDCIHVREVLE